MMVPAPRLKPNNPQPPLNEENDETFNLENADKPEAVDGTCTLVFFRLDDLVRFDGSGQGGCGTPGKQESPGSIIQEGTVFTSMNGIILTRKKN